MHHCHFHNNTSNTYLTSLAVFLCRLENDKMRGYLFAPACWYIPELSGRLPSQNWPNLVARDRVQTTRDLFDVQNGDKGESLDCVTSKEKACELWKVCTWVIKIPTTCWRILNYLFYWLNITSKSVEERRVSAFDCRTQLCTAGHGRRSVLTTFENDALAAIGAPSSLQLQGARSSVPSFLLRSLITSTIYQSWIQTELLYHGAYNLLGYTYRPLLPPMTQ